MRLWSFQPRDFIRGDVKNTLYLYSETTGHTKLPDIQYVRDTYIDKGGQSVPVKQLPIYCIARVKEKDIHTLSLEAFLMQHEYFTKYSGIKLEEVMMIELDVPERAILVMRKSDGDETFDTHRDYAKYLRDADTVIEAVIPYIQPEWIASYKTFHYYYKFDGVEVRTTVVNEDVQPAWEDVVYLAADGGVYDKDAVGNLNKTNRRLISLVRKYGMKKPLDHFTISEVLEICCGDAVEAVLAKSNSAGIFKDKYAITTMADLEEKAESMKRFEEMFKSVGGFV